MANVRITTNTTGTQPIIVIGLNGANLTPGNVQNLSVPFVQDVTITNSTGVYSYTTFTDVDTRKLSTPADNEISTNIVVDATTYFGSNTAGTTAPELGIAFMSTNKSQLDFRIYWNGSNTGAHFYEGEGFFTSLAPTTSPDAPVWVTPMTIAVDGAFVSSTVA
jgi:hypothetical protein